MICLLINEEILLVHMFMHWNLSIFYTRDGNSLGVTMSGGMIGRGGMSPYGWDNDNGGDGDGGAKGTSRGGGGVGVLFPTPQQMQLQHEQTVFVSKPRNWLVKALK